MKSKIISIALALTIPMMSQAARVAVTDSGTDYAHEWLQGRALINSKEKAGNFVDDDRNGKVDDIMGWNFVDDYGKIFFPQHLYIADDFMFKVFDIISRLQAGNPTDEDIKFWKENVADIAPEKKQALLAKLNFYGQYAHSTHCSGIIASISPESKMISNRVFPDTPPDEPQAAAILAEKPKKGIADMIYKLIAAISNGTFEKVAAYIKEQKIDVANYSLGISLQNLAKMALIVKGIKEPTPEQLSEETKRLAAQYIPIGKKWIESAPETLFVIAAGNDGSDNDKLPVFPAIVRAENALTVAASKGNSSLADFSNYGIQSVDIAAPGVAIMSSVPSLDRKKVLPMSGTSMATPYIVGVAAKIKDINPALKPAQIKAILMGTVDVKDWLKTKVISSGVVNPERAYLAAEKSKEMTLNEAISLAKQSVSDLPSTDKTNLKVQKFDPTLSEMKEFAKQVVF